MNDHARIVGLPHWPGEHPGTGKNDHVHSYEPMLALKVEGGKSVETVVQACQVCGTLKDE